MTPRLRWFVLCFCFVASVRIAEAQDQTETIVDAPKLLDKEIADLITPADATLPLDNAEQFIRKTLGDAAQKGTS